MLNNVDFPSSIFELKLNQMPNKDIPNTKIIPYLVARFTFFTPLYSFYLLPTLFSLMASTLYNRLVLTKILPS